MTTETPETPEATKARKLLQIDALLEAISVEERPLSKAFYHGWILSAAMELWDRGVLSREERLDIEARVSLIVKGEAEDTPAD